MHVKAGDTGAHPLPGFELALASTSAIFTDACVEMGQCNRHHGLEYMYELINSPLIPLHLWSTQPLQISSHTVA